MAFRPFLSFLPPSFCLYAVLIFLEFICGNHRGRDGRRSCVLLCENRRLYGWAMIPVSMRRFRHFSAVLLLFFTGHLIRAAAPEFPAFDFKSAAGAREWHAAHDISKLQQTPDGLTVEISGTDPYLIGPARDYPPGTNLWLHLRLKSAQPGVCQVFYFRGAPTEEASVRFPVPAGEWHDAQVPMPPLGRGYRLRIDPSGSGGICLLGKLWFSERVRFAPPTLTKPTPFVAQADAVTVQSGPLKLIHNGDSLGSFGVQIGGTSMASGHSHAQIAYLQGTQVHWAAMSGSNADTTVSKSRDQLLRVVSRFGDPDGTGWEIEQTFSPGPENSIDVETRVTVDQERSVVYLPVLTLLSGLGSFGTNKTQGLFAGLEYLENEPSSSEADVPGPQAARQVPDALKITFPLMAIHAEGRYLGLIWEPHPLLAAVFDSPDRFFGTEGHVMGLMFPGSDGGNRDQSSLLPYKPETISAKKPSVFRATLIGGTGESVAAAVEKYLALRKLPSLPDPGLNARNYFNLAAHGWLDSKIRDGDRYRHAAWPGFGAQPASDAALWMKWLSGKVDEPGLASRLTNAAAAAIEQVAPQNYNGSQIGHVRYPLPALIFGSVAENARQAQAHGRALVGRFQPDGSVLYAPSPKGADYARTHWSHEANGLTATVVAGLLDAAIFSGDRDLLEKALAHLRAMDKFRNGVPRGAQTWEVPLHTPDILASGYLLHAYLLGYELNGDSRFLDQANYWAWTGVPFVYLSPPTTQPVGLYSTIPVLGATSWTAPLWIGLPVQWCGLVYGEALPVGRPR